MKQNGEVRGSEGILEAMLDKERLGVGTSDNLALFGEKAADHSPNSADETAVEGIIGYNKEINNTKDIFLRKSEEKKRTTRKQFSKQKKRGGPNQKKIDIFLFLRACQETSK